MQQVRHERHRNPEVVALLELYLDIAKRHKMGHVAIAMCSYHGEGISKDIGVCDFAGDIALEHSERETLGRLVNKLTTSIEDWSLPAPDEKLDASHVVYNIAAGPLGWDFFYWLIDAEMTRVREHASFPLKVAFWPGKTNRATGERLGWLNHVFRPALAFIGAVEDDKALHGRNKPFFCTRDICAAFRAGEAVPRLTPTRRLKVDRAPVTITLREAMHWKDRNSNIPAWIDMARWLKQQGETVIFVRDTAKAEETIPGFPTYPAASLDVGERLSLYEAAKANLFVSNGPSELARFGTRPWLIFTLPEPEGSEFAANTPSFWRDKMGVEIGSQFPWCAPDQRIVWKPDTYENIRNAWEQHIAPAKLEAAVA